MLGKNVLRLNKEEIKKAGKGVIIILELREAV